MRLLDADDRRPANRQFDFMVSKQTSLGKLVLTYASLLVLLAINVASTWVHFHAWNVYFSLGIATLSVVLIGLFFMDILHGPLFHAVVFFGALMFMTLLLVAALTDSQHYEYHIFQGPGPSRVAAKRP